MILLPLQRGETPCDDCAWMDDWPHCSMNCSDTVKALSIPDIEGYAQPKFYGAGRDADNSQAISLTFDRELSDEELRALHNHIRKFHYRQPWGETNG